MDPITLNKLIDDRIRKILPEILRGNAFTYRKITDTPTDSLAVVNRRFVTLNGTVANRPIGSVAVIGQKYFATDTNIPMTFNGTNWRNGVGSVVASN